MTQEQLLDKIAEMLRAEIAKGPGTLAIIFDDDFHVRRIEPAFKPDTEVVRILEVPSTSFDLLPSDYLTLAKPLWRIFCQRTAEQKIIKLPNTKGLKNATAHRNPDGPGKPPAA
jgi:hypothetical protein